MLTKFPNHISPGPVNNSFVPQGFYVVLYNYVICHELNIDNQLGTQPAKKTLPKALRTQALTALTSIFGLVGLVQYAW